MNPLNLNCISSIHYYFIDEAWWGKETRTQSHGLVSARMGDEISLLTMSVSFVFELHRCPLKIVTKKTVFLMNMEPSVVKKKTEIRPNGLAVVIVSVLCLLIMPTAWRTGSIIVLSSIQE